MFCLHAQKTLCNRCDRFYNTVWMACYVSSLLQSKYTSVDLPTCFWELRDATRTGRERDRQDKCTLHSCSHIVLSRWECKPGIIKRIGPFILQTTHSILRHEFVLIGSPYVLILEDAERVLSTNQCSHCGGWNFPLPSSLLLQNYEKSGSLTFETYCTYMKNRQFENL